MIIVVIWYLSELNSMPKESLMISLFVWLILYENQRNSIYKSIHKGYNFRHSNRYFHTACSAKKRDGIHNFVFLTRLQIFVPRFGILFFMNHYFLVCMFK